MDFYRSILKQRWQELGATMVDGGMTNKLQMEKEMTHE